MQSISLKKNNFLYDLFAQSLQLNPITLDTF